MCDFKNAKVGDRVWSSRTGWTKIVSVNEGFNYPIETEEINSYTHGGLYKITDMLPTLFWDEVKIIPPPKPKKKVKKFISGWLSLFEGTNGNLILGDKLYEREHQQGYILDSPGRYCKFLGQTLIRHEYEVEE